MGTFDLHVTPGGRAPVLIEACVDSIEGAVAAEAAGAHRVELCDNLGAGGTTPSAGVIEICCERLRIPVFPIVRPRGGDFLYSPDEVEAMRRDLAVVRKAGAAGVVLGLLRSDGAVDAARTRVLVEDARPLAVTFHRAFDAARDPEEALERLVDCGVDRVLTSGQARTAEEGIEVIARLVARSAGRITILAGGGVREHNARAIVTATGVREVHLRAATRAPARMEFLHPTIDFGLHEVTDPGLIARLRQALAGL